uniref:Putative 2-oxoglutarate dehydrogenase e1 subunit n=1 Tax=Xenopsylla cheopis TaxID=163159 RepID=A0A6M2DDZ7_XENCH
MYRSVITVPNLKNSISKNRSISEFVFGRWYHTKKGVFGYQPKREEPLVVSEEELQARQKQCNFYRWVNSYRKHGHKVANVDPVNFKQLPSTLPELNEARYGLNASDRLDFYGILGSTSDSGTVEEASQFLRDVYCGEISAEFDYIDNEEELHWFAKNFEKLPSQQCTNEERKIMAELLVKSQAWDNFLATKFGSLKRYGGEGAESLLVFLNEILKLSAKDDLEHMVLGAAHRGKFNFLTGLLKCPPKKMFKKFKGFPEFPPTAKAMCDIASHFNASVDLKIDGKTLHVSMLHNPSHLEAVNPVSMGKTRSKQMTSKDGSFSTFPTQRWADKVLNVQMHGDAAFAGQGINQECLMMTGTPQFEIGGTIHMVINNQVGFTTPGDRGRQTQYCTDLAKSICAPVLHVNGDNPEMVCKATRLAFEYQRRYRKDIFVDLNCFRRWGHNELDDPTFTNPSLYNIIHNRKSVPDLYSEKLVSQGVMSSEEVSKIVKDYTDYLNGELQTVDSYEPEESYLKKQWQGFQQAPSAITEWDTGVDPSLLMYIGINSVKYPEEFNVHPTLKKHHIANRVKKVNDGEKLDWATAEAMAIGSLMYQGHNVRISGEDVGRGTFSHRHAMLVDQDTNEMFIPLNSMEGGLGGKLEIANSILSEEAVLGFEYGMAIDNPNNLIIWEAQFGDFFNGAQILIDTFIYSGETKWLYCNGMVMLLPHGYDGAASEHSSCRIERFLQMTDSSETTPDGDDVNVHVVNPTTPAQYYHLLRRQMVRNFRKPLVVVAPKTLLRLPEASSSLSEMAPGTTFQPVLGDKTVDPSAVNKVIFCSGKHYYALNAERTERKLKDVAIVRLESLCPFPLHYIQQELSRYTKARTFIWSQEEHRNMGAWTFVQPRFENLAGIKIKYTGRDVGATPAIGVGKWHQEEAKAVVMNPFDFKQ